MTAPHPRLAGRRFVVSGVLTEQSITWHVAAALIAHDAEVTLTTWDRARRLTRRAAAALPGAVDVVDFDASADAGEQTLGAAIGERWDHIDGVVHGIAAVSPGIMGGGFLAAGADEIDAGFRVSVTSFPRMIHALMPLLARAPTGASAVALSVDSTRALPGYDWMGVYKAALDASMRYTAYYGGPHRVRANVVAAGPVETMSASGVDTFAALARLYEAHAPLGWDRESSAPIIGPILFLLSDWGAGVSGQVLHADGGLHSVVAGVVPRLPWVVSGSA